MTDTTRSLIGLLEAKKYTPDQGIDAEMAASNAAIDDCIKIVERYWQSYVPCEISVIEEILGKIMNETDVGTIHELAMRAYDAIPEPVFSGCDDLPLEDKLALKAELEQTKFKLTEQPVGLDDDYNYQGAMADLHELVRVAIHNRKGLDGFLRDNYPGEWQEWDESPKQPKREISNFEAEENCPLCKRETTVSYYKTWSRNIDCKGCGFHDFHGILGEPPYKTHVEDGSANG